MCVVYVVQGEIHTFNLTEMYYVTVISIAAVTEYSAAALIMIY